MKTRHIVAIGLLTATAVGIVALSITFKKNKPKLCETKAYDQIASYTYNATNPTYTITGTCNNTNTSTFNGIQNIVTFNYTIEKKTNNVLITIETEEIYSREEFSFDYVVEKNSLISTGNKQIAEIDFLQSFNITDDRDYPIIDWTIQITPKIYFTDSTTTQTYILFELDQINQDTYYLEETNEYLCNEIPIRDTLNTLKTTYATGYNTAEGVASPIDIRGLMLNVLTMPFTFINQAFNITLWEGTPYAFNISTFIKTIIAIGTILFIIKVFTSGFSVIGNYTNNRTTRDLRKSQTELNKAKTEKINKSAKKDK